MINTSGTPSAEQGHAMAPPTKRLMERRHSYLRSIILATANAHLLTAPTIIRLPIPVSNLLPKHFPGNITGYPKIHCNFVN